MLIYAYICFIHDSLHWRASMNSFRLTTVKNTMLIYVHSFRLCQPLLSGWFHKLFFSRTGFVYVENWKNSASSSISRLCFLFVIYLRFIITLVKDMFDLQIDKKKKQKTKNCLQWIKVVKKTIVKIFYMWMFCITLKERNTKPRFVQNWHSPSRLRKNGHDFA